MDYKPSTVSFPNKAVGIKIMAIFSREARSPVYNVLRSIMVASHGTISISHAIEECAKHGLIADRSMIASARNQYKRMAHAASAIGATMPAIPIPAIPIPIAPTITAIAKPELGVAMPEETPIIESIESMSSYDEEDDVPTTTEYHEEIVEDELRMTTKIPEVNPLYHFTSEQLIFIESIEKLAKEDFIKKLPSSRNQLVGPAGCGKTTFGIQYAAKFKRPCFIVDCQTLREGLSLFGNKTVDKDGIKWIFSRFVEAVRTPKAVVILDELNRVAPMSMNTSLPLLDDRRSLWFDEAGQEIKVADGVTFFTTMNQGAEFTGTEGHDLALDDRFEYVIPVDYIDPVSESNLLQKKYAIPAKIANDLCDIAKVVRDKYKAGSIYTKTISTRILEKAAKLWKISGSDVTLRNSIVYRFPCDGTPDSERNHVISLVKGKGFKI
jgi:nitric oxide reductase NorQ protein